MNLLQRPEARRDPGKQRGSNVAGGAAQALMKSWHTSTRRGADELKNWQSPPLLDPLKFAQLAGPGPGESARLMVAIKEFAVLSDLPEQDDGNSDFFRKRIRNGILSLN